MRIIGIQHRVKRTAEGEARPTRVAIRTAAGTILNLDLADEQAELDFVLGELPFTMRAATAADKADDFQPHHLRWKELKEGEEPGGLFLKVEKNKRYRLDRVPADYEGLRPGDQVAMLLGGSGDYLAYALAHQGQKVGATTHRVPAFLLQGMRGERTKAEDHVSLAEAFAERPEAFFQLLEADAELILVRESWRSLWEAMQARMACEQRLRQYYIGRTFTSEGGLYAEGGIEKVFDAVKANDVILSALQSEEARRERELSKVLARVRVFTELLDQVEGLGPKIAGRIISAVIDIRRFYEGNTPEEAARIDESYVRSQELEEKAHLSDDAQAVRPRESYASQYAWTQALAAYKQAEGKEEQSAAAYALLAEMRIRKRLRLKARARSAANLKKYMGVHVLEDGSFVRRRHGQVANWHGDARQALFLLGDQLNRRPNSEWGQYLRKMKAKLRQAHPYPILRTKVGGEEVIVPLVPDTYTEVAAGYRFTSGDYAGQTLRGKTRYRNKHIHKIAMWRTLSRFVEWLYQEWSSLEKSRVREPEPLPLAA